MERHWKITKDDNGRIVFEALIPLGALSGAEVTKLLQRLAAQDLTEGEVIAASLRRNARGAAPLLEVHRNNRGRFALFITGLLHTYTAVVEPPFPIPSLD